MTTNCQIMPTTCLEHYENIHKSHPKHANECQRHVKTMPKQFPKPTQEMLTTCQIDREIVKTCPNHTRIRQQYQNIAKTFTSICWKHYGKLIRVYTMVHKYSTHALNMLTPWPTHAQNMFKSYLKYDQNMSNRLNPCPNR